MTLTNFWWLLVWMFAGGGFCAYFVPRRVERIAGVREVRWSVTAALLVITPYIIWAGFRSDYYGDTSVYRSVFLSADSINNLITTIITAKKDKGFAALTVILKALLGASDTLYFLVIAAIQLITLALVFRKYSANYWLSLFLFVVSTEYIAWCHNGMRQFLAVMVVFAGTRYLIRKNYIPLIILILFASTLHGSAIIMLPIIFIVQGKSWNKKTLLCIAASILVLFFVNQFTDLLENLMSGTQYSNMVTDWKEWDDDGTSPIRVLVYSIPMLLSILGYRQIRQIDNVWINILVNFSILTVGIGLVSMVTSGIFIGRLIIYPAMYSTCLLLPWELENLFTKDSSRFMKACMCIGYIIFFYYQMHISWGIM